MFFGLNPFPTGPMNILFLVCLLELLAVVETRMLPGEVVFHDSPCRECFFDMTLWTGIGVLLQVASHLMALFVGYNLAGSGVCPKSFVGVFNASTKCWQFIEGVHEVVIDTGARDNLTGATSILAYEQKQLLPIGTEQKMSGGR